MNEQNIFILRLLLGKKTLWVGVPTLEDWALDYCSTPVNVEGAFGSLLLITIVIALLLLALESACVVVGMDFVNLKHPFVLKL